MAFENVEPSGAFGLFFNSEIAGLSFLDQLNQGLASRGIVQDVQGQAVTGDRRSLNRNLKEEESAFNLDSYIQFKIRRGSDDSASLDDLGFSVVSAGLENSVLKFKLIFDSPLLVSMGATNDKMIAVIVDGSFFSSSENGLPVESGTEIEQPLPKMFPDEEFAEAMEKTESAV